MRNKILKFRAWDIHNKKFTYWTMNDLCTWETKDEKPSALDEWQQDTGLLDRHGKEIYEGDIVKKEPYQYKYKSNSPHIFKVIWLKKGAWNISNTKNWEIIGNIYQNPDLIN